MPTTIGDIETFLHSIAPNHLQEEYDNSGLIVGKREVEVKGVLISLDCIEKVIEEAIDLKANLVICHHPIVFKGLKRFNGSTYVERTVMKAIQHDIAIFAIHTNLDNVINGVNGQIANVLGLQDVNILRRKFPEEEKVGAGVFGNLNQSMTTKNFLDYLKEKMELEVVKHTHICKESISRVAVCGGSGGFLLKDAIKAKADVFITSDYKYHEFFDAEDQIIIVDIGHFESEKYTIDLLYTLISNKFTNFAAHCTKFNTNPVKYY